MRLGLLIYGSLDTLSGGYLYDRRLVEHLRACGDGVEVLSLPWRSYSAHLGDNLSASLVKQLERLDCDLLLQDELNHPSLFRTNMRLQRANRRPPIITIVHHLRSSEEHPRWQMPLYRQVERRYLRSVDGFIFNSEATRQSVCLLAPESERLPYVVARPAGDRFSGFGAPLEASVVQARAAEPGPLRIVFVGNLIARKGLHTLLEALARLPQDRWRLEVIGDPQVDAGYAANVRALCDRLGLDEQVTWSGRLDQAPLADALRSAHVLAVPSIYEGFGIVYLEGMGFGLPAVAGAGGAAEVVNHGQNGYLTPPGDAAVLAAHLERLTADRALLARMSLAALDSFTRHPGWDAATGRMRDFLVKQLESKPA